jgi:hypothetical protein
MMVFALFLIALALTACSHGAIEQNLRPDQQTVTAAGAKQKKGRRWWSPTTRT